MDNEVIRHIHKYAMPMYVMVSIPENKEENIYKSPTILGCFKSKEAAQTAWKARTPEYKSIRAKTVHIYCFNLQTDVQEIPETVFFCGNYHVSKYAGKLDFCFIPSYSYADIESYYNVREWLNTQSPISFRELCKRSKGWRTFYADSSSFCIKCPADKLVNVEVPLTDVAF